MTDWARSRDNGTLMASPPVESVWPSMRRLMLGKSDTIPASFARATWAFCFSVALFVSKRMSGRLTTTPRAVWLIWATSERAAVEAARRGRRARRAAARVPPRTDRRGSRAPLLGREGRGRRGSFGRRLFRAYLRRAGLGARLSGARAAPHPAARRSAASAESPAAAARSWAAAASCWAAAACCWRRRHCCWAAAACSRAASGLLAAPRGRLLGVGGLFLRGGPLVLERLHLGRARGGGGGRGLVGHLLLGRPDGGGGLGHAPAGVVDALLFLSGPERVRRLGERDVGVAHRIGGVLLGAHLLRLLHHGLRLHEVERLLAGIDHAADRGIARVGRAERSSRA